MRNRFALPVLVIGIALGPSTLEAQSQAIEAGLAGIENYDPFTPTGGLTLYVPVVGRLSASATYARWTGRDGNEGILDSPTASRSGYGNQAFLVTGLVRLLGDEGVSLSLGAGVGWFQHYGGAEQEGETVYDRTPIGTLMGRYPTNERLSTYLRADVQIPTEPVLNYGLVRLGLDVRLR